MTSLAADTERAAVRSRGARLVGPLAVAAGVLASVGLLAAVDPNQPGHFPTCPFKAMTGLDCPFCGGLRAVHDLAHGNVVAALDRNVLVVLAVPVVAFAWLQWLRRAVRPGTAPRREVPPWLVRAVIVLVLVFWVVRNIPGVPFLGSGVG
ncbi:MAG TPA: DUF2752 domain-containing protein [Actinomycetes bacterium]